MRNISNYIYESKLNEIYINELENIEIDNSYNIINESFQSSWLTLLAKTIKDIEAGNLSVTNWEEKYSFTSIFGPKVEHGRWKNNKLRSIKWSEITDSDFELYDNKRLKKLLKDIKNKKSNTGALIICCKPGTKNIKKFFNGLGTAPFKKGGRWVSSYEDLLYTIMTSTKRNYHYDDNHNQTGYTDTTYQKVAELNKTKYKYDQRPLKDIELYNEMKDLDNYVLLLTNSMFTDYKALTDKREEDLKGTVFCDEKSLEKLAKEQKARYQTLVKEIKRKKLVAKDKELFEEIKATQEEVNDLMSQIIGKIELFDEYGYLRDALQYTYRAMDNYSYYLRYTHESALYMKHMEDDYKPTLDYNKGSAQSSIEDCEQSLKYAKQAIKTVKENL